ncbi:hypothetical protein B0H13DRAFT_1158697 [Mycena leptocephala]|nr:hypothetical protein B0H13DRAFT_1158697 [Mycena leptocephala]
MARTQLGLTSVSLPKYRRPSPAQLRPISCQYPHYQHCKQTRRAPKSRDDARVASTSGACFRCPPRHVPDALVNDRRMHLRSLDLGIDGLAVLRSLIWTTTHKVLFSLLGSCSRSDFFCPSPLTLICQKQLADPDGNLVCIDSPKYTSIQPISERSWIPMSDIPTTLDEQMETFHRRNPRLPRPPRFNFERVSAPINTISTPIVEPSPASPNPSVRTHVPPARTPTPPPAPRSAPYEAPTQSTTRFGRVARPPPSKDYATSILKKGMM